MGINDIIEYIGQGDWTSSADGGFVIVYQPGTTDPSGKILTQSRGYAFPASGLGGDSSEINLKVSLSADQIKTANSVPIDIGLPASGEGFYYRATAFDCKLNYETEDFAVITLHLKSNLASSNSPQFLNDIPPSTISAFNSGVPINTGVIESGTSGNYIENDTMVISANTFSAAGDSTIDCYITVVKVAL
jgi:hypothetical protein